MSPSGLRTQLMQLRLMESNFSNPIWVWVKIKPPGIGPQILVHVSIYQGKPFWVHIFDPQPFVQPHPHVQHNVNVQKTNATFARGLKTTSPWLVRLVFCGLRSGKELRAAEHYWRSCGGFLRRSVEMGGLDPGGLGEMGQLPIEGFKSKTNLKLHRTCAQHIPKTTTRASCRWQLGQGTELIHPEQQMQSRAKRMAPAITSIHNFHLLKPPGENMSSSDRLLVKNNRGKYATYL